MRRESCGSSGRSPPIRDSPEIEPAEHHYRQALGLAEKLGMRPLSWPLPPGARHAVCEDRISEELARAELSTAIDLYRAMAMTFWLPEAEAALVRVEGR